MPLLFDIEMTSSTYKQPWTDEKILQIITPMTIFMYLVV